MYEQPKRPGNTGNMANFSQLTKEIENASSELESQNVDITPQEKQHLLKAAKEMVDQLEGPVVGIWRVLYGVSIGLIITPRLSSHSPAKKVY